MLQNQDARMIDEAGASSTTWVVRLGSYSEAHATTYFDHPPESVPGPAPIMGVPTPSPLPDHRISNGSLTPR